MAFWSQPEPEPTWLALLPTVFAGVVATLTVMSFVFKQQTKSLMRTLSFLGADLFTSGGVTESKNDSATWFHLTMNGLDGEPVSFAKFKNKVTFVMNVASK